MSPYAYCLNNPLSNIDSDGRLVIFIGGMHNGLEGGRFSYWDTQGYRPFNFTTAVKAHFDDWNYKYYDGGIGGSWGFFNSNKRFEFGYLTGAVDAPAIIKNLARNEKGEIIESIKVIAHSMGAAYAKGPITALVEYIKKHPELCEGLSISEYDFAPFQPTSQHAVNGVSTYQYSHSEDGIAKNAKMPGAKYMDTGKDENQRHYIRHFYDQIKTLPPGKYIVKDGKFVPM